MENTICVIGGANIDICGSSLEPLKNYDSNPGTIAVSYGGVGRNIAQICALLKQKTKFITVFANDEYGQLMRQDCEALGMDTSDCIVNECYPSSMYIAILDSNRDMKIAMSDMRILRSMTTDVLEPALKHLTKDDIIIIDSNLDMECIDYILANAPCKVAADPVSTAKAERLKDSLTHLSIFKPNQFESQQLTGIAIEDETTARDSLEWFLQRGVEEIIISMFAGHSKFNYAIGVIVSILLKWLSNVVSGVFFYFPEGSAAGSLPAWSYSVAYNTWYNLATMIVCVIVVPLLINALKKTNADFTI